MTKKEIEEQLASDSEPTGFTVRAADGRLFFLTEDDVTRTALPPNGLYAAFRLLREGQPHPPPVSAPSYCGELKAWLDHHSPNSAKWRALCLAYFDDCV